MNLDGIVLGAIVFIIIWICHHLVIKLEYHLGKNFWWILALAAAGFAGFSLFMEETLLSAVLGAASFSCLWGIREMIAQEKRVLRGWFPENPRRKAYYDRQREKNRKE